MKSGETAEETAMGEVREEVGLKVSELEVLGTCAIGSRGLLMIGFRAEKKVPTSRNPESSRMLNGSDFMSHFLYARFSFSPDREEDLPQVETTRFKVGEA